MNSSTISNGSTNKTFIKFNDTKQDIIVLHWNGNKIKSNVLEVTNSSNSTHFPGVVVTVADLE